MKKLKLLICLLLIFSLTGCVKYNLGNTVGPNKEFTLTIVNALLNEYYNKESLADSVKEYKKLGYEVIDYTDGKYSGVKLIKNYKTIDDVSTNTLEDVELINLLKTNTNDVRLFKVEKNGSILKYSARLIYDLSPETVSEEQPTDQVDYSEYAEAMYFGYYIALPTNAKVINHNADKVEQDNHVLSWEVEYGTKKVITFSFEIDTSKEGTITKKEEIDTTEKTENKEEEKTEYKEKTPKKVSPLSTVFSLLFIVAIVGGVVYLKIQVNSQKKKKKSDPTILYHSKPPKR